MAPPQGVMQVRGERGVMIPLIGVDPHNMEGLEGFEQQNGDVRDAILLQLLREGTPKAIELFDTYRPDMRVRDPLGVFSDEIRISDWAEGATRKGFLDITSFSYHQLRLTFPTTEPELDRKLEDEAGRRQENPGIMYFSHEQIGKIEPARRYLRYLQRQVDGERLEAEEQARIDKKAEVDATITAERLARKVALEDIILAKAEAIRLERARREIADLTAISRASTQRVDNIS